MQDIAQKAKSGAAWLTLSQLIRPGWEFLVGIVLARILSPEEFGIVAIGMIFYGLVAIMSTFGISSAIVQKKTLQHNHIVTAQTIVTLLGLLIFCAIIAIAPLLGLFFNKPLAGTVLSYFSINFVVGSFGIIPTALMAKKMQFKIISIIETSASIIYGVSALILAYQGFGVWSLVYSPILSVSFSSFASCLAAAYVPKFGWDKLAVRELMKFGGTLTLSSILNYIARNVDFFIIGKMLGTTPLGLYKRAYDLAVFPKEKVSDLLGRILFPFLCEIRDDRLWVKSAYLKTTKAIAFFCFPVLLGFVLTAPELIKVVYGEKWLGSIIPLKIISFGGMFYCLAAPFGSILLIYGKTGYYLILQVCYASMLLIGTIIGVQFGIEGVSVGVLVTLFFVLGLSFYFCKVEVKFSLLGYLSNLKIVFISCGSMVFGVLLLNYLLTEVSDQLRLFAKTFLGIAIYFGVFLFSGDSLLKDLGLRDSNRLLTLFSPLRRMFFYAIHGKKLF